ncbi:MAG: MFS transporter [Erysipelotrichaceae bacterium]|nr:MFS transporter [Erysipelotrichaceae bacterium]
MQSNGYNKTMVHCFIACSVQAITNNFAPLLFLVFQERFHLELSKITLLITLNFLVQLITDFSSTLFVDRIGYRISFVLAHFLSALGLFSLALLPKLIDPFIGLLLAVIIYAIGGGLIEVLNSPIVAALPADNKEKAMSLLHSFYCWGHVAVVLISTLLFKVLGMQHWGIVACLWALIPLYNMIAFMKVPLVEVISEEEVGMSFKELFSSKLFLILVVMMICSGASELSMAFRAVSIRGR